MTGKIPLSLLILPIFMLLRSERFTAD